MIYRLLALVAYGYTLHRLTYRFTTNFGLRLSRIIGLTIGALSIIPAKSFIWRGIRPSIIDCSNIDDLDHSLFTAEVLALGSAGAGVVFGHLLDNDIDDEI